jgi:hypothetical protein
MVWGKSVVTLFVCGGQAIWRGQFLRPIGVTTQREADHQSKTMQDFEALFNTPNQKRRPGKRSTPTITMSDCDCCGQLTSTVQEVKELYEKRARNIEVEFGEINQMPPNSALRLYDLFRRKPAGTVITGKAESPIIGSGVLVWLACNRRFIRPTAWIYFAPLRDQPRRRPTPPWADEGEWWQQTDSDSTPNFARMDYRTVLRLMNSYLPVGALAGRTLTPALLDEFDLLDIEMLKASRLPVDRADKTSKPEFPMGAPQESSPARGTAKEQRVWFIERNAHGRWTLKGGFPLSAMKENPELRAADIGLNFATKEGLLAHLDNIEFCMGGGKIVMDGDQVIRQ